MEIQSGNGVELEVVSGESLATSGSVSSSPYLSGPQADGTDDQVLREDLQAAKTIERFDIPLSSLKRMFEKPLGATNTVSTLLCLLCSTALCELNVLAKQCPNLLWPKALCPWTVWEGTN